MLLCSDGAAEEGCRAPVSAGRIWKSAGRARGSRNRLSDSFISHLRDCWERHGVAALERVAVEQPEVLVKVIAGILPRDLNLSVNVDASEFAVKFGTAIEALGNEPPTIRAKPMRVINAR
jgi:hypothetical protein